MVFKVSSFTPFINAHYIVNWCGYNWYMRIYSRNSEMCALFSQNCTWGILVAGFFNNYISYLKMNCMVLSLKFLSEYSSFYYSAENVERRLIRRRKKFTEYHDNVIRWQCFHFFQAVILCKVKILFNSCIYCVMLYFFQTCTIKTEDLFT